MNITLNAYIGAHQNFGETICQALCVAIDALDFPAEQIRIYPHYQQAEFELVRDPYTRQDNLKLNWLDTQKQRIGFLQFNSDNSFYAEYDVVQVHPKKPRWFVEAVSAWGTAADIKTEAKLLAMP